MGAFAVPGSVNSLTIDDARLRWGFLRKPSDVGNLCAWDDCVVVGHLVVSHLYRLHAVGDRLLLR